MPCEESRCDRGGGGQSVKQLRVLEGRGKNSLGWGGTTWLCCSNKVTAKWWKQLSPWVDGYTKCGLSLQQKSIYP